MKQGFSSLSIVPRELMASAWPMKPANPHWQVTVQAAQTMRDGKTVVPGYVQIDDVSDGQDHWSCSPQKLRAWGYQIEDFSKLPSGKYTYAQAQWMLQKLRVKGQPSGAGTKGSPR